MYVIDSNIHLPFTPDLKCELDVGSYDAVKSIKDISHRMHVNDVVGGNVMILDKEFIRQTDECLLDAIISSNLRLTVMIDPLASDAEAMVAKAKLLGAHGIKFHPYLQDLYDRHHSRVVAVAECVSDAGLWVAVDCSYGTRRVFDISGVRLVIALSDVVSTPLIALHGGGKQVIEVMSLAQEVGNVYLDLSFSIPYWLGSSVEQDYAFAIRQLGAERCMFGSDQPYVDMIKAKEGTLDFLRRHGFGASEIDQVMYGTAKKLFAYE